MQREMRERLAQIETAARAMARSGQYGSASSIEMALMARGIGEAHKVFSNRWTRSEFDRLCEQAAYRPEGTIETKAA
jgi:hypothetical protein